MKRFLVECEHPPEKGACLQAIREILEMGSHFVTHAEWGCLDNVHLAWIIVEAEDHAEARMVLPPKDRANARVIRLSRFQLDKVNEAIENHGG